MLSSYSGRLPLAGQEALAQSSVGQLHRWSRQMLSESDLLPCEEAVSGRRPSTVLGLDTVVQLRFLGSDLRERMLGAKCPPSQWGECWNKWHAFFLCSTVHVHRFPRNITSTGRCYMQNCSLMDYLGSLHHLTSRIIHWNKTETLIHDHDLGTCTQETIATPL